VEILSALPMRLKADLSDEVYGQQVFRHPFFNQLNVAYNLLARKVLCVAVEDASIGRGRELFLAGEPGDRLFFVSSGSLTFTDSRPEVASTPQALPVPVTAGMWMCEPVLWIQWKHVGQMTAEIHCELVAVSAAKVQDLLRRLEEPQIYARQYAAFFQRNPRLLTDVFLGDETVQNLAERAFARLEEADGDQEGIFSDPGSDFTGFTSVMPQLPGATSGSEDHSFLE